MLIQVVAIIAMQMLISGKINQNLMQVIDTFSTCVAENKRTPCGWYWTKDDVSMFSVVCEKGNQFVKICTKGGSTTIGIKADYDPCKYPILSWKWRVICLPKGAAENDKKRSDSGAGVYVVFHGIMRMNKIIKYVWSSSLDIGCVTQSPFNPLTKIIVLQSGNNCKNIGEWVSEKVNIQKDYQRIFHSNPPKVDAIAIMSDADNTNSTAEADYDDFWISNNK